MNVIHGGDIYRNQVVLDFSVNVNPLGMPKEVEEALYGAVMQCSKYPDIAAEELKLEVSKMLHIPKDYLLFGNGASELFMAVMHGVKPRKVMIPVPSFYGYEYAAAASCGKICYYRTKQEDMFCLREDFFDVLTEDVDVLFLANPNNPTGGLLSRTYLHKLLCHCKEKGIYVVLDECFIDFCGKEYSILSEIEQFSNLILVRAFTKIFAIPGVRLGYLVCCDQTMLEKIQKQIPEWNLSVFAQTAGCACAKQEAYIEKTIEYVREERQYLTEHLKKLGFIVFPGEADFILIYGDMLLYEELLKQGILIRNCENFRGLSKGFFRIAVKDRKENELLITTIQNLSL